MKVLLINPNRFHFPPVPPIGLEYLAGLLRQEGHTVEIVDLCFSEDIFEELDGTFRTLKPDIAGITVRNVDSVLYHTNEFFLDEIREIVKHIKSHYGIQVLIGGTGVPTNPEGILQYLDADFAFVGPAEGALHENLNELSYSQGSGQVVRGRFDSLLHCPRDIQEIDYKKYFDAGGIAGFETHKGCSSSCVYCIEANSPVAFKKMEAVIAEIKGITAMGHNHLHLCDSEFNEDLDFAVDFCDALKKAALDIAWAVYMKPVNYNEELFRLMRETGVYLVTLTVDSFMKNDSYWYDVEKIIGFAKLSGIKTAIDFLTGFPYEDEETLKRSLDFFRKFRPDSVNINTYIRLYKSLPITGIIMNDPKLREHLLGNTNDHTFIKPVFYNHLPAERLKELIEGDGLFRIEGLEKGVNYRRVLGKDTN